jgi:hypothetical protein
MSEKVTLMSEEIEKIARAMAKDEGDYRSSGWAGEATKRIWMRRAKIAIGAMNVPTEDTNADDDQEELK